MKPNPNIYDPTRPTTAEYWLYNLGDRRPKPQVLHVIAPTGMRAFEFALAVAASTGLDLEHVKSENLV